MLMIEGSDYIMYIMRYACYRNDQSVGIRVCGYDMSGCGFVG